MAREHKARRFSYKISRIEISRLKGIRDFHYDFGEHDVTAILGVNGCGKSTILHALACVYKPNDVSSKDYNRLSDFFKPNTDADWQGSEFKVFFEFKEQDIKEKARSAPEKRSESKSYSKNSQSWSPKYSRRPVFESAYIGLQDLQTGADNPSSYRYRNYETQELADASAVQVKKDMVRILGRQYDRLNHHLVKKGSKSGKDVIWGLEWGGVKYSELSMGAGEKRVLNILSALHHESFKNGGLLIVDELDALLHAVSFKRLIEVVIEKTSNSRFPLQVVFTTHRETISEFSGRINMCSILNTPERTFGRPYIDPDVMMQLTGVSHRPIAIYVEDDLSQDIVNNLVFSMKASQYVFVGKFGSASNAFAVISGMILLGQDVSNTICVLDGDVFLSEGERESEIKRHLNGDDKSSDRLVALQAIKSYRLAKQLPNGSKGAPEYNHKILFESSSGLSEQLARLQECSRQIVGLTDWHDYYDELATRSGVRKCRDHILDHLSSHKEWDDYLFEIRIWLEARLSDLGFDRAGQSSDVDH